MPKKELEFTDFRKFAETPSTNVKGLSERVIEKIRKRTWQHGYWSSAGYRYFAERSANSRFLEELYIIEGSIIDLVLNEEFTAGMVATRPPGMKHGPWKISERMQDFRGSLLFQIIQINQTHGGSI